ncbi:MAG TPA: hypothetical protein VLD67_11395 [Vicinamibacterales bacterium]|nr:hypothetical protein [Vicinamibacterales bacterium]
MRTLGSVAAVIAAIREEAAAGRERLEAEARRTLETLPAQSDVPTTPADGDSRLAAARREAAQLAADTRWRETVEDLEDRERWIADVVAAARRRLETPADTAAARAWITALAREAMQHLPSGHCTVVVSASMLPLVDERWRQALSAASRRQVSVEAAGIGGGCIVRLVDQPIAYDNSLDARIARAESRWRVALARLYEAAVHTPGEATVSADKPVSRPGAIA